MPAQFAPSTSIARQQPRRRSPPVCIEKPRRTIRFPRRVYVRAVHGLGPVQELTAATLSKSGMYVRSSAPLAEGTEVELFFDAAGRALYFGDAVVSLSLAHEAAVRVGCFAGFRLEFKPLPTRSQALVHRLVELAEGPRVSVRPEGDAAQPGDWRQKLALAWARIRRLSTAVAAGASE